MLVYVELYNAAFPVLPARPYKVLWYIHVAPSTSSFPTGIIQIHHPDIPHKPSHHSSLANTQWAERIDPGLFRRWAKGQSPEVPVSPHHPTLMPHRHPGDIFVHRNIARCVSLSFLVLLKCCSVTACYSLSHANIFFPCRTASLIPMMMVHFRL
ncbi:hypothetical protein SCLCIDRAFT_751948 [Scleroderma citrinum Foug A]|uniref:Uncharacterized protein n=1 Tax=Scleroderma citrinum Foug A TaxID=1036808 RepID=A0A0C3DRP2_9AGAM|nr:hypothetical protein SCLCIDRAFT_751948 [Scleroderma citrinum Foug A]